MQWKCSILTTGQPGKSWLCFILAAGFPFSVCYCLLLLSSFFLTTADTFLLPSLPDFLCNPAASLPVLQPGVSVGVPPALPPPRSPTWTARRLDPAPVHEDVVGWAVVLDLVHADAWHRPLIWPLDESRCGTMLRLCPDSLIKLDGDGNEVGRENGQKKGSSKGIKSCHCRRCCLFTVYIPWTLTFHCAPTNFQVLLRVILCLRGFPVTVEIFFTRSRSHWNLAFSQWFSSL